MYVLYQEITIIYKFNFPIFERFNSHKNDKGNILSVLYYINQLDWTGPDCNAFNHAMNKNIPADIACVSTNDSQI